MCGDNLKLEPMNGDLEPDSHQNIKMTLHPARFPTHFEGEIECAIDWYTGEEDKMEMRSMHTNTNVNENQEHLFLRLKKRTKFVSNYSICSLSTQLLIDFEYDIDKRYKSNRSKRK